MASCPYLNNWNTSHALNVLNLSPSKDFGKNNSLSFFDPWFRSMEMIQNTNIREHFFDKTSRFDCFIRILRILRALTSERKMGSREQACVPSSLIRTWRPNFKFHLLGKSISTIALFGNDFYYNIVCSEERYRGLYRQSVCY